MSKSRNDKQGRRQYREMTVAHIREIKGADHVEVVFLESARFYRLLKKNPAYDRALKLLRNAMARGCVLRVRRVSLDGDIIKEVQEYSSEVKDTRLKGGGR